MNPHRSLEQPTVTLDLLDDLARAIDAAGIEAIDPAILALVADVARRAGAPVVLAEIVVDPAESPSSRDRAFGRLARHLAAHREVAGFVLVA